MINIVSDSSILYSKSEALEKLNVHTTPLSVCINNTTYREFEDINSADFLDLVLKGNHPSSSQPAIGEKLELYEELSKDGEVLDITMAAGLSGTYDSACSARASVDNEDKIHVFNSKTLCGPHKFLVEKASEMVKMGMEIENIICKLNSAVETEISFLIPFDFSFLVRGGRVNGIVGGIGGLLKLIPVMAKTQDGRRLEKYAIARTLKKAIKEVIDGLKNHGCDSSYNFYISHAFNNEVSDEFVNIIREEFKTNNIEKLLLSPAFITQGGPKCVAVQAIKM